MKERDTFERAYGNSCYSIVPLHLLDLKCDLKLKSDANSFPINSLSYIQELLYFLKFLFLL